MPKSREIPRKEKLFGTGQKDFFNIVPDAPFRPAPPTDAGLVAAHQEQRIDALHKATNKYQSLVLLVRSSADHETRDFYKSIGWTEEAKTAAMNNKWNVAMFRLREVGVLNRIRPDLTLAERDEIIKILKDYDRDHKMTQKKWKQFALDAGALDVSH